VHNSDNSPMVGRRDVHNSDTSPPWGGGRDVHNSDTSLPVGGRDVHNGVIPSCQPWVIPSCSPLGLFPFCTLLVIPVLHTVAQRCTYCSSFRLTPGSWALFLIMWLMLDSWDVRMMFKTVIHGMREPKGGQGVETSQNKPLIP